MNANELLEVITSANDISNALSDAEADVVSTQPIIDIGNNAGGFTLGGSRISQREVKIGHRSFLVQVIQLT